MVVIASSRHVPNASWLVTSKAAFTGCCDALMFPYQMLPPPFDCGAEVTSYENDSSVFGAANLNVMRNGDIYKMTLFGRIT